MIVTSYSSFRVGTTPSNVTEMSPEPLSFSPKPLAKLSLTKALRHPYLHAAGGQVVDEGPVEPVVLHQHLIHRHLHRAEVHGPRTGCRDCSVKSGLPVTQRDVEEVQVRTSSGAQHIAVATTPIHDHPSPQDSEGPLTGVG